MYHYVNEQIPNTILFAPYFYLFIGIKKIIANSGYVRLFQRPKGTVCKGRTAQEGAGAGKQKQKESAMHHIVLPKKQCVP